MINYDTDKLDRLMYDFFNATGINMDFYTEEFESVSGNTNRENIEYCKCIHGTAEGNRRCVASDAELLGKCKKSKRYELHLCHAGLIDVAVPIIHEENIVGYVIFGQIRTDKDFSEFEGYIDSLGLDTEDMRERYGRVPVFEKNRIDSVLNIAVMLAKHIMLENMLKPDYDRVIDSAVAYIDKNLDKPLSVMDIARAINSSKTVLYDRFHGEFGCTVSEYVNTRRISKAAFLLKNTDLSVEEISQRAGFSGASYFCKIFKRQKGISPSKYRQSAK